MKTLINAAIAVGLLASTAAVSAAPRENVALKVSSAGVDFADPASVVEFRRSVERQIEAACNPGDRIGADMRPDFKCRAEMSANLNPKVRQLALRASRGQGQMATTD